MLDVGKERDDVAAKLQLVICFVTILLFQFEPDSRWGWVGGTLVCSVAVSVKMNVLLLAPPLLLLLLKVSNPKMSLC